MSVLDESLRQKLRSFARRHRLLCAGDRLGVAVSGGADSTALLRLLLELRDELGLVLSVVHFNHGIRGAESDADQRVVQELADRYELPFHLGEGDAPRYAREHQLSLETAARQLRYEYFNQLFNDGTVSKIATAHTLDDQAETVLLRLLRGAGTKGLAGIYPKLEMLERLGAPEMPGVGERGMSAQIVRPLLSITRPELEGYLRNLGQSWREDATNRDVKHARNRVRHRLLPLLEKEFNPGIRQVLADTAEVARGEQDYWQQLMAASPPVVSWDAGHATVNLKRLLACPLALQRRWLRSVLEQLGCTADSQTLRDLLELAENHAGTRMELPGNWIAYRTSAPAGSLEDAADAACPGLSSAAGWCSLMVLRPGTELAPARDYEYDLPVPGMVAVPELGMVFRAVPVSPAPTDQAYNRGQLLDSHSLGPVLRVRNWRPGDRFWPAHAKSSRKVKELLQGRHVSGPERPFWPVIANSAGELVWMRGFAVPERFQATSDSPAISIHEEAVERAGGRE